MNLFKVNICDCQLKWQLNSNSMTFNVICNQKGRARFSREKKHEFHWNYTLCVYGPVLKVLIIMVIVLLKHLETIDVNRIELPINRCINTVVSCFFHFFFLSFKIVWSIVFNWYDNKLADWAWALNEALRLEHIRWQELWKWR